MYYGLLKEPDLTVPPDDDEDEEKTAKVCQIFLNVLNLITCCCFFLELFVFILQKKKPKKEMLSKKSKNDPHAPNLTRIPLPELYDITYSFTCFLFLNHCWVILEKVLTRKTYILELK